MQHGALIVFAKSPIPGRVKTRLTPFLKKNKAAALYKALLEHTLRTAIKSDLSEVRLWIDGDSNHSFFKKLKRRYAIRFYRQQGNDLGKRMAYAADHALKKYPFVIIIGGDCPGLTISDLSTAATRLSDDNDIVLGPANDGGYYLIGLKQNNHRLFENIKWSTASVFDETCLRVNELNWRLSLLPEHRDLDRTSDLNSYFALKQNRIY